MALEGFPGPLGKVRVASRLPEWLIQVTLISIRANVKGGNLKAVSGSCMLEAVKARPAMWRRPWRDFGHCNTHYRSNRAEVSLERKPNKNFSTIFLPSLWCWQNIHWLIVKKKQSGCKKRAGSDWSKRRRLRECIVKQMLFPTGAKREAMRKWWFLKDQTHAPPELHGFTFWVACGRMWHSADRCKHEHDWSPFWIWLLSASIALIALRLAWWQLSGQRTGEKLRKCFPKF